MQEEIRLLSLWQPWASLIAMGVKKVETRHWSSPYRGLLAIHAAKRKIDAAGLRLLGCIDGEIDASTFPYGAIVAVAKIWTVSRMTKDGVGETYCWIPCPSGRTVFYPTAVEKSCGHWEEGRYAWILEAIRPIEPIYTPGKQGLSVIRDAELLAQIEQRLAATAKIEQLLTGS